MERGALYRREDIEVKAFKKKENERAGMLRSGKSPVKEIVVTGEGSREIASVRPLAEHERGVEGLPKRGEETGCSSLRARDLIVGRRVGQGKALRWPRKTAALRMPEGFREAGGGQEAGGHTGAAGGQALRTLGCEAACVWG